MCIPCDMFPIYDPLLTRKHAHIASQLHTVKQVIHPPYCSVVVLYAVNMNHHKNVT